MVYDNLKIRFQLENVIIEVSKISNEIVKKPYPMNSHSENGFELHYIASGDAIIETQEKMVALSKGTFYVTSPFMRYAQFPSETKQISGKGNSYREYSVCFNIVQTLQDSMDDAEIMSILKTHQFIISENSYKAYGIFKEILFEVENQQVGYIDNIISLVRILIINAARMVTQDNDAEIAKNNLEIIRSTKRNLIIDDLFLNSYADLTLPKLSKAIGFSERQTQRYLSKEYGKTFNQKKLEARMAAAKVMLIDESVSIDDIAVKLGYVGNSKFLSSFKSYYGITARQFRKDKKFID